MNSCKLLFYGYWQNHWSLRSETNFHSNLNTNLLVGLKANHCLEQQVTHYCQAKWLRPILPHPIQIKAASTSEIRKENKCMYKKRQGKIITNITTELIFMKRKVYTQKKPHNPSTYWAFIFFRSFMLQCVHYKCIAPLEYHSTLSAFVLSFHFVIFHGLSFGLFHFFPSLYQLHGNLSWKNRTFEWILLHCTSYPVWKFVLSIVLL